MPENVQEPVMPPADPEILETVHGGEDRIRATEARATVAYREITRRRRSRHSDVASVLPNYTPPAGWTLVWARYYGENNTVDHTNLSRLHNQGYETVDLDEIPADEHPTQILEGRYEGKVGTRDAILMKIPTQAYLEIQAGPEQLANEYEKGVNDHAMSVLSAGMSQADQRQVNVWADKPSHTTQTVTGRRRSFSDEG